MDIDKRSAQVSKSNGCSGQSQGGVVNENVLIKEMKREREISSRDEEKERYIEQQGQASIN